MRKFALVGVVAGALLLDGCAAGESGNGSLFGMTSPYVQARMNSSVIGSSVENVVGFMGPPDKSYSSGGKETLAWSRVQQDADFGTLSCTEMVEATGGVVTRYQRSGRNCGR